MYPVDYSSLERSLILGLRNTIISGFTLRGGSLAQANSRRLPITAVRVRPQVKSCGTFGGRIGVVAGFLRVFRFPLPIVIPPAAPHLSSHMIRGWHNGPAQFLCCYIDSV
jgi:hypothetical protein